jgi:flavin-binding protein dodecin
MVADIMLPDYVPDSVEDAIGDAIGDAIDNVAKFLHGDTVTKNDASADKNETPSSADAFGDMVADMMIPDYVPDAVEDAIGNAIGDAIDSVTKFLHGDTGNQKDAVADTSESADTGDEIS